MVLDRAGDPWEPVNPDGAGRSSWSWSRGGPARRGWPHSSRLHSAARTRPWHPTPTTTFAAYRGSHAPGRWTRARRGLRFGGAAERREAAAAAAGANAAGDLVEDGAEGFSRLVAGVVAREVRGSAGGAGGFGWKTGRAPDASSPPTPKRRAVSSSTRRFPPPLRGRESAAHQILRSRAQDGLRVGASHSHGGFGSIQDGGLLPALALDKVVAAANGGASAPDQYPHRRNSTSVGNAGSMQINGARGLFGTRSAQFGKSQLLESPHALGGLGALAAAHHNGSLAYGQSATGTVGTMMNGDALDGVVECQELEEGEIADTMEISEGMVKSGDLSKPMEGQELEEGEIAASATMVTVGVMNRDTFYGSSVEGLELEEGEIAPHMDTAEAMNDDTLYGSPVEVQQLEEGEIAPHMDTAETLNENTALYGSSVQGLELEEGEIAATMGIVESANKESSDGTMEVQESEEGVIAATIDIVEPTNNQSLDGVVVVQELEQTEIAAMDIVEGANKDTFVRPADDRELEQTKIAAMDIVKGANKDTFVRPADDRELEQTEIAAMDIVKGANKDTFVWPADDRELEQTEIAAMDIVEGANKDTFVRPAEDQELEGEIAAKGHDQEPDDGEIGTQSDHIVQQSVNVIPCGSIGGIMRSKIRFTARKTVRPPVKVNHLSQLVPVDTPFFTTTATMKKFKAADTDTMEKFKGAEAKPLPISVASTTTKKFKGAEAKPLPISVASTTMKKFKAAEAKPVPISLTSTSAFFTGTATMKKFKGAEAKPVPVSLASTSELASKEKRKFKYLFITKEKLKGKRAVYLDDDDILKALVVHEGKLELCLSVGSIWRHRKHGGQNADPRSRVRTMCRRFEFLCRFLAQAVKQGSMQLRRVDLAADQVIKKLPDYTKRGSIVGKVAGIEVGDVFLFRVELAIVGLHNPYRAGIDTTKDTDGELIAVSIVASGGYLDEFSRLGELVYTGSGGKAAGHDQDGDQKLQRGNLALKNCIKRKIPVRVIHGFKSQNREEGSHSIGKEISKFIYDGLYHVVGFWQEGIPGSRVFKYRLRRIPGQPELPPDVAKWLRKSVLHPH